jgi:hypothetical protein
MLEDQAISKSGKQMLDGSNFSNIKIVILSMKKVKQWMYQEQRIRKTKTSKCGKNIMDSTNNGILSILKT